MAPQCRTGVSFQVTPSVLLLAMLACDVLRLLLLPLPLPPVTPGHTPTWALPARHPQLTAKAP